MKNESLEGRTKRLSQLTPFKKGLISNPHGRGIGKDLWQWAAKLGAPEKLIEPMRRLFHIPYGKLNVESAIILRLALEACRGDMKAIELWMDRKYGKVTIPMDISTENGPLVLINQTVGQNVGVITTPAPQPQEPPKKDD